MNLLFQIQFMNGIMTGNITLTCMDILLKPIQACQIEGFTIEGGVSYVIKGFRLSLPALQHFAHIDDDGRPVGLLVALSIDFGWLHKPQSFGIHYF